MSWAAVAIGGATLVGGALSSRSADKAAKRQAAGSQAAIDEQRAARESFEQRVQPFTDIGLSAADPLMSLLGIGQPQGTSQARQVNPEYTRLTSELSDIDRRLEQGPGISGVTDDYIARARTAAQTGEQAPPIEYINNGDFDRGALTSQRDQLQNQLSDLGGRYLPDEAQQQGAQLSGGQDQLLQEINPLVSFLRQEGFEDIQESAAAKSRLGAGGTLKDLTKFNTQLTSTIVPQLQEQKFNQLFNVLGLGQSSAVGQGQAALQSAGNIGNLQQNIGAAQAQGVMNQNQAVQNTIGGLAGAFGAHQAGLFNTPPPPTQPIAQAGAGFNSGGFA